MKKRGSALIYVIAFSAILLMVGTVVASAVIATTKYNQEHSNIIDLELAAKSGLNLFKEQLILEIKAASNSSELPNEVDEINSGISDFDGIDITKRITKDEVREAGVLKRYKYTIYSKAIEVGGTVSKEVSQIITVNINNNDGSIGDIVVDKFISAYGNVTINSTATSLINNICYGNNAIINNNNGHIPDKIDSDKILKLSIKDESINRMVEEYSKFDNESFGSGYVCIENKDIRINNLTTDNGKLNFNNANILFENGWTANNNSIINNMENSNLIFNANVQASNLNIEKMINSKFIVNGNLHIQNNFNFIGNESKNNVFFIRDNLKLDARANINLKNSIIIVGGDIKMPNGANITLENSAIIVLNNMNIDTQFTITNKDRGFLLCAGSFTAQNGGNIVMGSNNLNPDNHIVLEAIDNFLNIQK